METPTPKLAPATEELLRDRNTLHQADRTVRLAVELRHLCDLVLLAETAATTANDQASLVWWQGVIEHAKTYRRLLDTENPAK